MTYATLVLIFISCVSSTNISEQCTYIDYLGKQFNLTEIECPDNNICNGKRALNVRYIVVPPYFYKEMRNDENKGMLAVLQKPVH